MWSSNQIIFTTVATNQIITTSIFKDEILLLRHVISQSNNFYNSVNKSNNYYIFVCGCNFFCLEKWRSNQIILTTVFTNQIDSTFCLRILPTGVDLKNKSPFSILSNQPCHRHRRRILHAATSLTIRYWKEIWTMEKGKERRRSSVNFWSGTTKIPIQEMEPSSFDLGWLCFRIVAPKWT